MHACMCTAVVFHYKCYGVLPIDTSCSVTLLKTTTALEAARESVQDSDFRRADGFHCVVRGPLNSQWIQSNYQETTGSHSGIT